MAEVDYKRVREIMWTDKAFRLRELPAYFEFPLLIKVVKGSDDMEHKEKFAKGEILRIDGEEKQRRVIATDSKGRHWSFPVHIGAKFEVKNKKEKRKSMYMSEIVDAEKLPKKFSFAKKDDMQIKITGEEHSGPLIEGDFKTKEMTRVRIFKANRISDGDINLKVVFLPAYIDVEVVIATKLACEPDAYWEDYMDAMTSDISRKVNLNMYRGKSDIQIYEFPEKAKKSKQKSTSLYEEQAPTKIVSIGSIIKQRTPTSKEGMTRKPSLSSTRENQNMMTFSTPEGAEAEPEEPKRAVADILTDLQDKDESEMTEEEKRVAKHRRMLLAMLDREEEEEEEKRRSQMEPDGATCDDDDEDDDDDDDNDDDDKSASSRGEGDGDVIDDIQRPRSPGDGSTVSAELENNEPVFVDDSPTESVPQKPRIPTRRTPGLSYPQSPTSSNPLLQSMDQQVDEQTTKARPPPPLKPKPTVPGQKPAISPNKPTVPLRKPALIPPVNPHVLTRVRRAQVVNSSDPTRFATIQDFPSDLRGLTIDDMCKAMQLLCLGKYEEQIRENKIDGEMATELSEDIITSDLGLTGLEAKKLYKFIHHNWRPI